MRRFRNSHTDSKCCCELSGSLCIALMIVAHLLFIGEKEGRISHESLTALSFYVVGGNLLFTLYLMAVYVRAALRESRTGGVAEQRRKSQLVAAQASPSPVSERGSGEEGSVAKTEVPKSPGTRECGHHGYCGPPGGACGQAERGYEAFEAEARVSDEKETGGC